MVKVDELGDSRLITGGRIIRTSGLDELPQLLNVLRGEMSLVGPRPCLPEEYALYRPDERKRLAVHPGLTGYWQVEGKNKTRFSEMVAMDLYYVRQRSFTLDLFVLVSTPLAILKQLSDIVPPRRFDRGPVGEENDQDARKAHC